MAIDTVLDNLKALRAVGATGVFGPDRPDRIVKVASAVRRWGLVSGVAAIASARFGDRTAIVDELGPLSFEDVDERTSALAAAWYDAGLRSGDGIGILCRNSRFFLDAMLACAKLGGSAIYLNTSFAGPQIADVAERENAKAIVFDEEFSELVQAATEGRQRWLGWTDSSELQEGDRSIADAVVKFRGQAPPKAEDESRVVMLTSGTTGTPKGASREAPRSLLTLGGLMDRFPMKTKEVTMVGAPMFHSWGFAQTSIAVVMGSTLIVHRRFDPEKTLKAVAEHRCTSLMVVPVMLQRMLDLDDEVLDRYDTSSLRIIGAGGSALPGDLATKVMDQWGDILFNLYGSTEVSIATIALPEDLRAAPGTAGKPVLGTVVRLYDDQGRQVSGPGKVGRIFVGADMAFEGYTGGGTKEEIDGLMSSGDVGHFDAAGRLFVDGRDDEMIVSGAENVFPREVEDLLSSQPEIAEAAVIGVPDEEFGQRLKAFVVPAEGVILSDEQVKDIVRANLARFKSPREVVFLDALPRNATGKVLKKELAAAPADAG
jgi:fatty-acyl-CoA synthase